MHRTTKRPGAALLAGASVLALTTLALPAPSQAGTAGRDSGSFSGKLVNQATGRPVGGATVKVYRINTDTLLGSDTSGSLGKFRIDGLSADDEELDVRVNGSAVHFETGWVACNHKVVRSWGEACSYGQGHQTPFFLQHS